MTALPAPEVVTHLSCPNCTVQWTLCSPRWLGPPWTREQADRLLAGHDRFCTAIVGGTK